MRALGASDKQELDKFAVETDVDAIVLCSDGLTNMLSVEQIESVLNDEELDIETKLKKCDNQSRPHSHTFRIAIRIFDYLSIDYGNVFV